MVFGWIGSPGKTVVDDEGEKFRIKWPLRRDGRVVDGGGLENH
jgi:hypothetical protein